MIQLFRYLAIAEGYSFLLILFVTMPLKYIAGIGFPNQVIGMAHGFLFIAYIAMTIVVGQLNKWDFKTLFIVGIMSIVPFGTFWMEDKYLSKSV